jgi:predicted nuclease with TOPRIM domain
MLNDGEVKRVLEAITEYRELVEHSSEMRDQLEALHKRWNSLRSTLDRIHQTMAQLKADYQVMMRRVSDISSTEDTVLDSVKFLIDELASTLKKHEVAT